MLRGQAPDGVAAQPVVEATVAGDGGGQLVQGSDVQGGGFEPAPEGLPQPGPREEEGRWDAEQERTPFHVILRSAPFLCGLR